MAKPKKEEVELTPSEKMKALVREERPDLDDEGVEREVANRLGPSGGGSGGFERSGQPNTEPVRTEDNPKPQGTF
jgi:hypothetical protein